MNINENFKFRDLDEYILFLKVITSSFKAQSMKLSLTMLLLCKPSTSIIPHDPCYLAFQKFIDNFG